MLSTTISAHSKQVDGYYSLAQGVLAWQGGQTTTSTRRRVRAAPEILNMMWCELSQICTYKMKVFAVLEQVVFFFLFAVRTSPRRAFTKRYEVAQ
jgi:hypothetical protein